MAFLVQGAVKRLGELSSYIRQGNPARFVVQQPASFGSERHGAFGGPIEPPDGSPLFRIPIGRLVKQTYQSKCHCFGVVGHC